MFDIENIPLKLQMDVIKFGTAYEIVGVDSDEIIVAGIWNEDSELPNDLGVNLEESIVCCVKIYGGGLRIEIE